MFTFSVITCNRLHYLKNCVNSIIDFVGLDDINLLIVDNNTVEDGFEEYISTLPPSVGIKIFRHRSPNELHRAMNYSIKYARKKGDKYINFIQDDYQYLYKDDKLLSRVADAFSARQDVVQLQTNLVWKRKHKKIGKVSVVNIGSSKWYLLHNKPPCDNGFTRVSLYKEIGLYPKKTSIHGKEKGYRSGEAWFARKCSRYRRMILAQPNMGMLMDCAYVRGNKRCGRYISAPNKYYLKPFDSEKIEIVSKRASKNKFCFIEDMIEPDGWKPDSMHQKHSTRKVAEKF